MLLLVFTWNYFLLPNTVPYYLYHLIEPIGINPLFLLILTNLLFIVLLSLIFIPANKATVKEFNFEKEKDKKRMFWICQILSVILVMFVRLFYEGLISMI
jgi:hypothetical protein